MPQFAANLSMLYPELAFLDRFDAAAKDGFKAVEYLFPYDFAKDEIAGAAHGTTACSRCCSTARPATGTAASAAWPACPGARPSFAKALPRRSTTPWRSTARASTSWPACVPEGLERDGAAARSTSTTCAGPRPRRAKAGRDVLIEPINTRDIPRFFLNRQDHAHEIVETVGAPNLKVQMDLYHCQIVEGDVAMKIRKYLPTGRVGHIQIAGVPERHEPDIGELNYPYLFDVIDEVSAQCGWQGWVGCEYRPQRGAVAGRHLGRPGLAARPGGAARG